MILSMTKVLHRLDKGGCGVKEFDAKSEESPGLSTAG